MSQHTFLNRECNSLRHYLIDLCDALATEVLSLIFDQILSRCDQGAFQGVHGRKEEMTNRMEMCGRSRRECTQAAVDLNRIRPNGERSFRAGAR